ncbi:MAG: DNA recombination protein RmuC [Leptospirales bacterium]|nr:DNA recombination protein RmuC [Leptospirales bacterium]HNJ33540.1 DNA recombination protein RmuC [Leptospiraceae bacterium]HNL01692.1 DNA recombination protein RmuC [Leptospiraceae bacterium]HNL68079.1 DNA recombination protein RmuC [Leptospiraceae bacterium]HNN61120.1 DNA recombination protein RmuC [Leptospiraceae bacterium]
MTELLIVFNVLATCGILLLVLLTFLRKADQHGPDREILVRLDAQDRLIEKLERTLREEAARSRQENSILAKTGREEIQTTLQKTTDSSGTRLTEMSRLQLQSLDTMRKAVEERLRALQEENVKKLDQMRATVDEKLQSTLERRLSESFRVVSDRLDQVHKGLGEMQNLAIGVGDLKKVLTNVKTRGTWGEIQLSLLLEQILSPDQYQKNVRTRSGGTEFVEFAIKIPIRDEVMWLPVDSKFPQELFERLGDAQEKADVELAEKASRELEAFIKKSAKEIAEKYIEPPHTTDYAILFLPTEGLYAEVIRRPGLASSIQSDYRIAIAGPTTLAALLNAFQMGFRTLAIQKRSSEAWKLLEQVQHEFSKFGTLLDKTQKKLQEATDSIESARGRADKIQKRLGQAGRLRLDEGGSEIEMNGDESQELLGLK